jgi:hypothetical protein
MAFHLIYIFALNMDASSADSVQVDVETNGVVMFLSMMD